MKYAAAVLSFPGGTGFFAWPDQDRAESGRYPVDSEI